MIAADLARGAARALSSSPRRAAIAWALATALALGALAGAPGVSRDEAAVIDRTRGAAAAAGPAAPLAPALAGAAHAVAAPAGLSHLRAARLGTVAAGALLSALVALGAGALAGSSAALLAPALFWLAPRHLHAGLVATPDLALAALALAAMLAWRRALAASGAARLPEAALAGALLGGAVLARPDAWVLLAAVVLHAIALRLLWPRAAPLALALSPRGAEGDGSTAPPGLAALALLAATAAAVVAVAWPSVMRAGLGPWRAPAGEGGAAAVAAVLLATPVTLLLAWAGGAVHAALRAGRALRARAAAAQVSDDLLFLLAAAAALAGAAVAPAPAGARPALHAAPFLAILGARALLASAALAWPARAVPLSATVVLLALYPGLRAGVRAYPHGVSTWNEAAGGLPGGASRGLPRDDGGAAAAGLLASLNDRARPGARIWWAGVAPGAVAAYARDGRLRPDLAVADDPDAADLAVVALSVDRDPEYRAWTALRTARPAAGLYVDDVPLAVVYARPGAWR